MKLRKGKFVIALLVLALSLAFLSPIAYAAGAESGEIPVKISFKDDEAPEVDESYKVMMQAGDKAFPMPAGSQEGIYTMTIVGANTGKLPKIEFSSIGVYSYKIWQEEGDNEDIDYDDSKYNLVIYVTNTEDMEGLETTVLLYKDGESTKYDEIEFVNEFDDTVIEIEDEEVVDEEEDDKEKPPLPKTGASSNLIYIVLGVLLLLLGLGTLVKRKYN